MLNVICGFASLRRIYEARTQVCGMGMVVWKNQWKQDTDMAWDTLEMFYKCYHYYGALYKYIYLFTTDAILLLAVNSKIQYDQLCCILI